MPGKRSRPQHWLHETECPIIPVGGKVCVHILDDSPESPIIKPDSDDGKLKTMAKMQGGKIVKAKIVAVAPPYMQDDGEHKSNPLWRPGMIVYLHTSFEPAADMVEYMHRNPETNTLEDRDVLMVFERNIEGVCRHDDQPKEHLADRAEEKADA